MRDRANEVRIRINDGITVPQVRLIDEKGEPVSYTHLTLPTNREV